MAPAQAQGTASEFAVGTAGTPSGVLAQRMRRPDAATADEGGVAAKSGRRVVGPADPWRVPDNWVPAGPLLLALDTSTSVGGVALCRGATVLGEETWLAGGQQTSQVLPAAARLWERAGHTAGDLQVVAVATGPGSFTGLRIGVSLGKGFALALGLALVGVSTLDVIAYQHRQAPSPLCAVVGAGRGRCYAGFYERRRGGLWLLGDYAVLT
ncbi:MAG: tRNA (adenosine(37)-N6)-threonylcarbamoyltransferase complex dimerization subunit type 1 TsaB, partial [Chloroflexota bacterium]